MFEGVGERQVKMMTDSEINHGPDVAPAAKTAFDVSPDWCNGWESEVESGYERDIVDIVIANTETDGAVGERLDK